MCHGSPSGDHSKSEQAISASDYFTISSSLSSTGTNISQNQKERFLQLILPLRNRLLRFARAVTDTDDDADDLVSETILAALQGFHRLESEKAFASWLFTTASRIQRRKRTRGKRFQRYEEGADPEKLPSTTQSPDVGPDIEALYQAMGKLPEKQREAIALHEISGLPLEKIRKIQGGSLSGVKMRLARGRKKLAELLGAEDDMAETNEQQTARKGNEQTSIQLA